MAEKIDKSFRLLRMHERLSRGESIKMDDAIAEFGVPQKTFHRDISSLRLHYAEQNGCELVYDRKAKCYRLIARTNNLTKEEIFAVCKILTESRAFNKREFEAVVDKLLLQCDAAEAKLVKSRIANERINYIPLQHGRPLVGSLWELSEYIAKQRIIRIYYKRLDGATRTHEVKPVGLIFSEFYFYLIGFMADESKQFPTVFRVDRIDGLESDDLKFRVPYRDKFSEAEFRKRVQFMYPGELRTVRFIFRGPVEAVLDRLPTARIEKCTKDGVIIRAEAYGSGIDMWLRSQGEKVEMIELNSSKTTKK